MTRRRLSRRDALALLAGAGASGLAGCASLRDALDPTSGATPRDPPSGPPDRTVQLRAAPGTVSPAPGRSADDWLYAETLPGPAIRASADEIVAVELDNQLPAPTTIHWHGIPLANSMDGVPNVTQQAVPPGEQFTYRFRASPPGTYFYHSHVDLQLDRGLAGPLVIEEPDPHVAADREYIVVLDDFLPGEPRLPDSFDGFGGPMGPGMMGGDVRPPYEGLLVNGHLPAAAPVFETTDGERLRLRFVNASSATLFHVALGGHTMTISHTDGRPVEPVPVDSFVFGPGERYDAIVTADNPGAWELRAASIRGSEPPARAVVQYDSAEPTQRATPPGSAGRQLRYADLVALESPALDDSPDRVFDLVLSTGQPGYSWTINGQRFPDADPLRVREGEHVRVRMRNMSAVHHPMHLHGHFFQVGDALKDTVIVPGPMGQVQFDFRADNPGNWLFHCHNLYHLEAGMARVVQYR